MEIMCACAYLELKPQLSVAFGVLSANQIRIHVPGIDIVGDHGQKAPEGNSQYSCSSIGDVELHIEKRTLCLRVKGQQCAVFGFTVTQFEFQPLTCHGLQIVDNSLHFRVHINMVGPPVNGLAPKTPDMSQVARPEAVMEMQGKPCCCVCRRCGHLVVENLRLDRVMELPSESWKESCDSWFCHQDEHTLSTGDALLRPRAGQCLVSTTELVLANEDMPGARLESGGSQVLCGNCRHTLGAKHFSHGADSECASITFSFFALRLRLCDSVSEEVTDRWGELQQDICHLLTRLSSQEQSFRIIVETRNERRKIVPFLLLWILEFDSKLCIGKTDVTGERLEARSTIKVLYRDCQRDTGAQMAKVWLKDFTVNSVEFPESVCHELLHGLIRSTEDIPRSIHRVNNFYVGHLCKMP